jgi:hypothetical protein
MTAISRFDISIANLRGRGRQTSDPPEGSRLPAHPRVLSPLVDRPPPVNVRCPTPTMSPHVARSHERADRGLESVAWDEPGGVEMTGPGQLRTIRGPVCTAGRPRLTPAGCPPIPGAEGCEGQW